MALVKVFLLVHFPSSIAVRLLRRLDFLFQHITTRHQTPSVFLTPSWTELDYKLGNFSLN